MRITDKGKVVELREGQTAQMVRWLAVRASRVDRAGKGSVTFYFAGKSVQAELKEKEDVERVLSSEF